MQETEFEELKRSSLIMFIGLDSLYNLHAEVELEGNNGVVAACAHCSALADGVIAYPCPSVEILMMDPLSELEETISEISEPAEAEQPSS